MKFLDRVFNFLTAIVYLNKNELINIGAKIAIPVSSIIFYDCTQCTYFEQVRDQSESSAGKSSKNFSEAGSVPTLPTSITAQAKEDEEAQKYEFQEPLSIEILKDGKASSLAAKKGDKVKVHFVASYADGQVFETTRGTLPLELIIGNPKIIDGFNDTLVGMRVGELRKSTIPPSKGYGHQAPGKIRENASLVFEIELLANLSR